MIKIIRSSILLLLFSFFVLNGNILGQGLNPHFGTSSAVINNFGAGHARTGFVIGGDGRLNEGKMYFVVGLQYHRISLVPQNKFRMFPDGENINFIKFRVGLGYDLFNIGDLLTIRGKTLASLDLVGGLPEGHFPQFNDSVAGAVLGLGVDVLIFTFDVEIEKGVFNIINMQEGTKIDFVNFTVGVIF